MSNMTLEQVRDNLRKMRDAYEGARHWATILVDQLIKLSLINPANIGK